ncbi:MAG TPA: hypothetical protein VJ547_01795 [Candidatus Thermoplasmatota archaeon]|nr:hypothetical protein [Candidatus Thermoplasmatota archaeon]
MLGIPDLPHPPTYPTLEEFAIMPDSMKFRTIYMTQLAQLRERRSIIRWASAAIASSPLLGGFVAWFIR